MGWLTNSARKIDSKLEKASRIKGALPGAGRGGNHQLGRGRRKGNMIEKTCSRCGAVVTTVDLAAAREQAKKAAAAEKQRQAIANTVAKELRKAQGRRR